MCFQIHGACNKIFKREIFENENVRFSAIWYEDLALIPSLVKYAKNVGYLQEELYMYRQHENSIMSNEVYSERLLEIIKSVENLYKELSDTDFREELEYLYIFQLIYYFTFKFIKFNKYEDIQKCVKQVELRFPNWRSNKYYNMKPKAFKIFCELIVRKQYYLVKILKKFRNN